MRRSVGCGDKSSSEGNARAALRELTNREKMSDLRDNATVGAGPFSPDGGLYRDNGPACTPTYRDKSANVSRRDRPFNHLRLLGG